MGYMLTYSMIKGRLMPLGPHMKFSLDHMGRGIRVIKVLAMKAAWTGKSRFQGGGDRITAVSS